MDLVLYRRKGFLSAEDCRRVRQAMDTGSLEQAEVLGPMALQEQAVRRASLVEPGRAVVGEFEERFDRIRESVARALGRGLGAREGPGFLRYPPGGFYRPHRDRGRHAAWPEAGRRAAALVVFLNTSTDRGVDGDFAGGTLKLFADEGEVEVFPEAGLLVAFPADALHEVTVVRDGVRDTIVDWFYDPDSGARVR